jgi:NADPH:quinone reductase-like Zn-dependent oxidoreductase
MKALEIDGALGVENLRLVDKPDPKAGPGQVLVRMRAVSLNYRDLLMVSGAYGPPPKAPIIPFSDGCGVVEAVGAGVSRVKPGDRVSTLFFQNWISGPPTLEKLSSALGLPIPGCGRELAVFSEEGVSRVPDDLTDLEASTLACAALTAWRALFVDAHLRPGDAVLLQGTGGVSIFGLQFAKAAGLRCIITSSSHEKLERARLLGADAVIHYGETPEWSKAARQANGGEGVDFIMEVGGAKTLNESLRAIRIGGHIAIIGVLSGPQEPLSMPMMIGTSARLQGLSVGSRDMFEAMVRAMTLHQIKPVVDKVLPFREAQAALGLMARGDHFGKIVLDFAL